MQIELDGIKLFYEKSGEGEPLILIHGNGENHTIFDKTVAVLEKKYCCYAIDSRGHGQSTPVLEYHYTDMARDVVLFMKKLKLRNVTLCGFSDGGIVGILAAAHSKRVTRLITCGANVRPEGLRLLSYLGIQARAFFLREPLWVLMAREPHISDNTLRKIRAKTLVLAGEHDMITEKETRHIAETIPGAEMKILPGETHGSYIIHSEKLGEMIMGSDPITNL